VILWWHPGSRHSPHSQYMKTSFKNKIIVTEQDKASSLFISYGTCIILHSDLVFELKKKNLTVAFNNVRVSSNFLLRCDNWIYSVSSIVFILADNSQLNLFQRWTLFVVIEIEQWKPWLLDVLLGDLFPSLLFGAPPFCIRVWQVCSSLHPTI